MQTTYAALRAAFLAHVADDIGAELDAAFQERCPDRPEQITLADAASVVTAAVLGNPPETVVAGQLVTVGLVHGPRVITMEPEHAMAHPLLRDWLPLSITGALHQAILAGAMAMNTAPGCPRFGDIEAIVRSGGESVVGFAWLEFPAQSATAILCYGDSPKRAGLVSSRRLPGEALARLGAALPLTATVPHAVAQEAALEAADAALVNDAFLAFQEAGGVEQVH